VPSLLFTHSNRYGYCYYAATQPYYTAAQSNSYSHGNATSKPDFDAYSHTHTI